MPGRITSRRAPASSRALPPRRRFRRSPTTRFLSDCHTGALVAPDGSIDWLCVPRFDAPSIFGNLLDRQGGSFRLGPFGINVPSGRVYEPGTNTLVTTWKTPNGWMLVRDALTVGPRRGEDEVTPHTRPPVDEDGDHLLVRTVLCLDGSVQVELICDPVFDYGRTPAEWKLVGDDRHTADASGAGVTVRLRTNMALGIEGDWIRARHEVSQGEQLYCSLSWAKGLRSPQTTDEANERLAATTRFWRGWLGRAACPTTGGASRSSARRWRSRA